MRLRAANTTRYANRMNPLPAAEHHYCIMTKIQIPIPLRQYAGKQPAVEVEAANVGEALAGLVGRHPDLRRHLFAEDGKLRAFVNVYVNDEDVRYLQKDATTVSDGDTISIVPSIAGGLDIDGFSNFGIAELNSTRQTCCCPACCCSL